MSKGAVTPASIPSRSVRFGESPSVRRMPAIGPDSRLSLGPALVRLNRQWGCYLQVHGPRIQIPGTGGILKEALVDGSIACAITFRLLDRPKFAADEIVALQVLPGSKGLLQPKGGWHDEIPSLGVGKIPREVAPAAE